MKWEILKGSEKDFEGMTDGILSILENDLGDRYPFHLSMIAPIGRWFSVAERRPITEPDVNQQLTTEWDGKGLPPVGCIVECFTGINWHRCKVVLTGEPGSKTEALVYNVKTTRPFWADEFRPIRSAEDVARDAAIEAMRDVGYTLPAAIRFTKEEMAAIYDAGYRKVE